MGEKINIYPVDNKRLNVKNVSSQPKNKKGKGLETERKSMTKADLVAEISEKTGIEKIVVQTSIEAFMNSVKDSLEDGKNVYLRGFGSFVIKKRAQKTGRNIAKNTAIIIPEHFVPSFKPAKTFIDMVKSKVKS